MTNSFLRYHKLLFTLVILYKKPVNQIESVEIMVYKNRETILYLEELDAECEKPPTKKNDKLVRIFT